MMGRSHVVVGLCAVSVASSTSVIDWSYPNVAAITSGLVLAGTVLPDIDSRGSVVSTSWGPVSEVWCHVVRFVSRRVYLMSRLPNDPKDTDPHRTFTHTWPGAVLSGAILMVLMLVDRVFAAVAVAMLFGIAVRAWKRQWQWHAAAAGGILAWDIWPDMGGSVWVFGAALAAGCMLHVYSDCVTKGGAPLAWPFATNRVVRRRDKKTGKMRTVLITDQRWHMGGPPYRLRFYVGSWVEPWVVRGTVVVSLLLSYWLAGTVL